MDPALCKGRLTQPISENMKGVVDSTENRFFLYFFIFQGNTVGDNFWNAEFTIGVATLHLWPSTDEAAGDGGHIEGKGEDAERFSRLEVVRYYQIYCVMVCGVGWYINPVKILHYVGIL